MVLMLAAPELCWPSTIGLSLTNSPLRATHLFWAVPMGSHPVRSLPLKIALAAVHALGMGRFSAGARTPETCGPAVSPRFSTPLRLSPETVKSQAVAGATRVRWEKGG